MFFYQISATWKHLWLPFSASLLRPVGRGLICWGKFNRKNTFDKRTIAWMLMLCWGRF